jgi:hypothetical protein
MRSELSILRASVERRLGRCAAALVHVDDALAQADRVADPESLRRFGHAERAEIRHCNRAHDEAAADEAVVVGADAPAPALLRARARFTLARALWDQGDLVRGRAAAEEARTHARDHAQERAAIDEWLRAHEIRCPSPSALARIAREL